MNKEKTKYEEWLTTLSNTRLIYNTMDELEEMLDNHAIHSNGIKRSLPSMAKQRSAFRDLKEEVKIMTDGHIELDQTLEEYREAWHFYKKHLSRRKHPEKIAENILSFAYPPHSGDKLSDTQGDLYQSIIDQKLNVPILFLIVLKALPGYDSKEGDAFKMDLTFNQAMELLNNFTSEKTIFSSIPAILKAQEEENKSRIMLIHHVTQILNIYESYAEEGGLYDISENIKASKVHLDIEGYWNTCGGKLENTDFWFINEAANYGTYFASHCRKNAENQLTIVRYTIFLIEGDNGKLIVYVLHPESILHHMNGIQYQDKDHVWYVAEMPECEHPDQLFLDRMMSSSVWNGKLHLTRCREEEVIENYKRWEKNCETILPYAHVDYTFLITIYAITQNHIYIGTQQEGEYYKVPRNAIEGLDRITLDDMVGIMEMGGVTYLAFDEVMIYIPTTKKELDRYGIEISRTIE